MARVEVVVVQAGDEFPLADGDVIVHCAVEHRRQYGEWFHLTVVRQGGEADG